MQTLTEAISALHAKYRVPHVMITSVSLPAPASAPSLFVIGSTMTSSAKSRIFQIEIPALDCFFSGTGDMFAALMLVRLCETVSTTPGLRQTDAWVSQDEVEAINLPLATAAEMTLASMQEVLTRTKEKRDLELEQYNSKVGARDSGLHDNDKDSHLRLTKAAEIRLVRNLDCLRNPQLKFKAQKVDCEGV